MKNIKEYFTVPQNGSTENNENTTNIENDMHADNKDIKSNNNFNQELKNKKSTLCENNVENEEDNSPNMKSNAFEILMNRKSNSPKINDGQNILKTKNAKRNKNKKRNVIEVNDESEDNLIDKTSLKNSTKQFKGKKIPNENNSIQPLSRKSKSKKQMNELVVEEISNQESPKSSRSVQRNKLTNRKKKVKRNINECEIIEVEALIHSPPQVKINLNNRKTNTHQATTSNNIEEIDYITSEEIRTPSPKLKNKKPRTPKWKIRINLPPITKQDKDDIVDLPLNSDDCIFSPIKKRKHSDDIEIIENHQIKKICLPLAPIFVQKNHKASKERNTLKSEISEAKLNFLNSGLPDTIKKKDISLNSDTHIGEDYLFPKISSIIQKDDDPIWNLPEANLKLKPFQEFVWKNKSKDIQLGQFLKIEENNCCQMERPLQHPNSIPKNIMENFKSSSKLNEITLTNLQNKSFITKQKKQSKKNSKATQNKCPTEFFNSWIEKYKPQNSNEVIGNINAVNQIGSWLDSWKIYCEKQSNKTNKKSRPKKIDFDMDSSNNLFYNSDDESSDDENDPLNPLIVMGDYGLGKTATIYALAEEKGFKVLELNCTSTKRSGKKLIAEFLEATQSHQVPNANITNFFTKNITISNHKVNKKTESESNKNDSKKMSLILIEDVDLIFDDNDEGFISGLNNLILNSKRPIVLIANDSQLPHIVKFTEGNEVVIFETPNYTEIANWLQLVCLAENIPVNQESILNLVQYYNGDIRRCLMKLQFWVLSGGEINPSNSLHDFTLYPKWKSEKQPLFGIFPDLPCIYSNIESILRLREDHKESNLEDSSNKNCNQMLKTLSNFFESISWIETTCFDQSHSDLTSFAWTLPPRAGVSLVSSNTFWDSEKHEMLPSLGSWLSERTVLSSRIKLEGNDSITEDLLEKTYDEVESIINHGTSRVKQSWRSKLHSTDRQCFPGISLHTQLDRKALSCDYLPFFREVARSENTRLSFNSKRANRFFHYYKSLGIHMNDLDLEILRKKLNFTSKDEEENKMET